MRRSVKSLAWVAFALVVSVPALGQDLTSGTIAGKVSDPTGRGIPEAAVIATSEFGTRIAKTDVKGEFILPYLKPGTYNEEFANSVPRGRAFTDTYAIAPGVVSGLGTGQGDPSIGGASGLENSYLIDGVKHPLTKLQRGNAGLTPLWFPSSLCAAPRGRRVRLRTFP